ncbi:MAG: hypothetical protein ACXQT3_01525 [Methermicoccaceae archaeon]
MREGRLTAEEERLLEEARLRAHVSRLKRAREELENVRSALELGSGVQAEHVIKVACTLHDVTYVLQDALGEIERISKEVRENE